MEYEILAPAGDLTCAEVAINSGANAVYLGLNAFSARANAENFDNDSLIVMDGFSLVWVICFGIGHSV